MTDRARGNRVDKAGFMLPSGLCVCAQRAYHELRHGRNNVSRVQIISYKAAKLVSLDFSGCAGGELPPIVAEAKALMARQPRGSALVLTNVTGTEMSKAVTQLMKDLTTHNKPFVKA